MEVQGSTNKDTYEFRIGEATMRGRKTQDMLAISPTRRQMIVGTAAALGGIAAGSVTARGGAEEEISHTCEAIHQEIVFNASRKRIYEALLDAKQFNQVTQLSAAVKSGMSLGDK